MKPDNFFPCVTIIEAGNCDILLSSIQLNRKKTAMPSIGSFFLLWTRLFYFSLREILKGLDPL